MKQKGRYNYLSNYQKLPFRKSKKVKVVGSPVGYRKLFDINIQQPTNGNNISMKGSNCRVTELNSQPSPSILEEQLWIRERLVRYLEMMLMKARGSIAGIPALSNKAIITIRQRLEASLQTYTVKSVILRFIVFCRTFLQSSCNQSLLMQQQRQKIQTSQIATVLKMTQLVKRGETLRYHTCVKEGQKLRLVTLRKLMMSVEIMVRKDTQEVAWKPKMSAQMRTGIRTELKMRKIVKMMVLRYSPLTLEDGRMQLTSLSTIKPNRTLVMAAVMRMTYWMVCQTQMSLRQVLHVFLIEESVKEATRLALQQHLIRLVSPVAVIVVEVQMERSVLSQLWECEEIQTPQMPIMVQLRARKSRMIRTEKKKRMMVPQMPSQQLSQLMSSGGGGLQLLTNSFLLLKMALSSGQLIQQQQQVRVHEWEQVSKRQ